MMFWGQRASYMPISLYSYCCCCCYYYYYYYYWLYLRPACSSLCSIQLLFCVASCCCSVVGRPVSCCCVCQHRNKPFIKHKNVFSLFLNVYSVAAFLMSTGKLFHRRGAATLKARSPNRSRARGTTRSLFVSDRRVTCR